LGYLLTLKIEAMPSSKIRGFPDVYGIKTQNTVLFIVTAVTTIFFA
jgi:hypothetical protein